MSGFIQFLLLGLGAGAVYTLLSQGVVLIYRASGVINFAHGAMAMTGAYSFYELTENLGWSLWTAGLATVALTALVGVVFYVLILRRLRNAAPLTRVVATLGLLIILQSIATIRYANLPLRVPQYLPHSAVRWGSVIFPRDRLWLTGIAVLITVLLYLGSRFTMFGVATTAVAENEEATATLGWSPDLIASVNWALGGAVAGFGGILIVPITGLDPTSLPLLVIPAMAAALLANFRSFPVALASGIGLGVAESEIIHYVSAPGIPQAVPFVVIVAVLAIRGKALPIRGHLLDRLPSLGSGRVRPQLLVGAVIAAGCLTYFASSEITSSLTVSFIWGIALLSVVVVTGYTGQLSLAQFGLGGVGALVAGRLIASWHWPFEAAMVVGVLGAVLAGVIVGLPSLRARGASLALVTLGLGLALQQVVFGNAKFSGGVDGTTVGPQTVFGISIDPIHKPVNYSLFCLVCLVLASLAVCNLRRGRSGRRLLAVRTNERAAAAIGVNVKAAKLYAFALAAGIAGISGILLAFQSYYVNYDGFDPLTSITTVGLAVVGGVGFVIGPLIGATLAPGGFPGGLIANHFGDYSQWLTLAGGIILLVLLLQEPNGMAKAYSRAARNVLRLVRRSDAKTDAPYLLDTDAASDPPLASTLTISNVVVRYGATVAVNDMSFSVAPGEIVGVIGPNGAGKTTLIDAISGFARINQGTISLNGKPVQGLSPHKRVHAGIARSFQSLELLDDLTVLENLRAAADNRGCISYLTDLFWPRSEPLSGAASRVIRDFGLEQDLGRRAEELPHGRRRLVAVARAVTSNPGIVLLDEPAAGLGDTERAELGSTIQNLAKTVHVGVLLVEHDTDLIMRICDRIVVMDFGCKIAEGTPAEIAGNPLVIAAYLGIDDDPLPAKPNGGQTSDHLRV